MGRLVGVSQFAKEATSVEVAFLFEVWRVVS
jgi:hypothetical protein